MNILDENVPESERQSLRDRRIPIRQIGYDIGHKGLQDQEIIPFLHRLRRPTFFTRDSDFYEPKLRHANYCLVYLAVSQYQVATLVQRVLRHSDFNTQVKRMGTIIRASNTNLTVWRLHAREGIDIAWRNR